jgi:TRAP-type C4-dicarboxylate transport system permease small subunit
MAFGLTPHQKRGVAVRVLVAAGLVYAGLFSLVVILYWNGLHTTISNVLGFPASTAVMLFVLGPSPIVLVLIYMFTFSRWILLPQDEARFRAMVSRRRKERAN